MRVTEAFDSCPHLLAKGTALAFIAGVSAALFAIDANTNAFCLGRWKGGGTDDSRLDILALDRVRDRVARQANLLALHARPGTRAPAPHYPVPLRPVI